MRARALEDADRIPEAVDRVQGPGRALSASREVAGGAMWRLGWYAYLKGDFRDAAKSWEKLVASTGNRAYRIGAIYWRAARGRAARSDRAAAMPLYRQVLAEAPRSYYGVLAARRLGGATDVSIPGSDHAAGRSGRGPGRRSGLHASRAAAPAGADRGRARRAGRRRRARDRRPRAALRPVQRLRARRALPSGAAHSPSPPGQPRRQRRSRVAARVLGDRLSVRVAERCHGGGAAGRDRAVSGRRGRAGGVLVLSAGRVAGGRARSDAADAGDRAPDGRAPRPGLRRRRAARRSRARTSTWARRSWGA